MFGMRAVMMIAVLLFVTASFVGAASDLCGDEVCQRDFENETSCPQDCVNIVEEGILEAQEGYMIPDIDVGEGSVFSGESAAGDEAGSDSSSGWVIGIVVILVLIILGVIGFIVYSKRRENKEVSDEEGSLEKSADSDAVSK